MTIYLLYVLIFIINNFIMFYSLYFDIKYRRIPNSFIKSMFLIILAVNATELIFYSYTITFFFTIKVFITFLTFLIVFFLFNLKIIGGADGKLIIIIFLMIPIKIFSFSLILNYLIWFLILQSLFIWKNLIFNNFFNKKLSFNQFFMTNGIDSKFKRIYFTSFYRFRIYSQLDSLNTNKFTIKNLYLYFNFKTSTLEILTQSRPPLILLIIITYYLLLMV
jgi:Flp pilus assembly protein protease CpaA